MKVLSKYMYGGKSTYKNGGTLKPVPQGNKGLAKLPTAVRNKMGYMEEGGYLGYQKPEEYKDITLRPSEIPMFDIHETYSDLDRGNRREKREER
jgi:hypothetical protein